MIGHSGSCPTSGGQFKSGAIHLVTRVGIRLILCGAGEVVCESGHCTLGAVAITGGGAVTQGHRSTPAEVIIGVGRQVDRAGFLDRSWTVQCVIGAGDVERSLRPTESRKIEDKPRFSRACRYSRGNPKSGSPLFTNSSAPFALEVSAGRYTVVP